MSNAKLGLGKRVVATVFATATLVAVAPGVASAHDGGEDGYGHHRYHHYCLKEKGHDSHYQWKDSRYERKDGDGKRHTDCRDWRDRHLRDPRDGDRDHCRDGSDHDRYGDSRDDSWSDRRRDDCWTYGHDGDRSGSDSRHCDGHDGDHHDGYNHESSRD